MKPPRIYARGGFFWIRYFEAGKKNEIRRSTAIKLDIAEGDDWKKSKHRAKLQSLIKDVEFKREAQDRGVAYESPSDAPVLEEMMDRLNREADLARALRRGELSPQTIRRRRHSLSQVRAFDKNVEIHDIDADWLNDFRLYLRGEDMTDWTIVTVFADLKMLLKYAVSKGYIDRSPADVIQLGKPVSDIRHTPFAVEQKLFTALWKRQRPTFYILITERLSGFRASDILSMKADAFDLQEKTIWTRNVKLRRMEGYPISDALLIALAGLPSLDRTKWHGKPPLAFHDINYFTVRKHLIETCAEIGIDRLGTHQFKRNFSAEVENGEMLPHIFNLLLHHVVKGMTETGATHYTGRNIMLMRRTLNAVQGHWLEFLVHLTGTEHGQGL